MLFLFLAYVVKSLNNVYVSLLPKQHFGVQYFDTICYTISFLQSTVISPTPINNEENRAVFAQSSFSHILENAL